MVLLFLIVRPVNTTTDITGLKPATMYTVAVRAYTAVGPGPLGESKNTTTADAREYITAIFLKYSTNSYVYLNNRSPAAHVH